MQTENKWSHIMRILQVCNLDKQDDKEENEFKYTSPNETIETSYTFCSVHRLNLKIKEGIPSLRPEKEISIK